MIHLKNKKLHRSPRDGIMLGIAAGLGHYFEIDPVFVRIIWLGLAVVKIWPALILYAVLFFVMPIDPAQDTVAAHQEPKDVTSTEPAASAEGSENA